METVSGSVASGPGESGLQPGINLDHLRDLSFDEHEPTKSETRHAVHTDSEA